jgi:hypothetical protein
MHGEAAGRALAAAGADVETSTRISSLDEVDADAVVVALPPEDAGPLLGESWDIGHSPIVSVHLLFDRPLLSTKMGALLASDAHWVFDRGALTGREPPGGQYLTVVSSGAPELVEIRGRALVDRIAGELTARLGDAELLWSRVSREPQATVAARPGLQRPERRGRVVLAGAWLKPPWPPTMESAVRSGKSAARAVLAESQRTVAA